MTIQFTALEYTADDGFSEASYEFRGSVDSGWEILRQGEAHLLLGAGYELLETMLCGICATDLARRFLPFPLPQVTGHEIVARRPGGRDRFVVEINDTSHYRGDRNVDIFSRNGLPTHTPGRMVLGIDRLPGGFGPYILAPAKAILPCDDIDDFAAVLTEPFAAALQAVSASPPAEGSTVAVLGPRRLGALVISALHAFRRTTGRRFTIVALSRHENLLTLARRLGADEGVDLSIHDTAATRRTFDIVYDTTGSAEGFEHALRIAEKEVHLKSTHGRTTCGLKSLTAFVVDELSLLPFSEEALLAACGDERRSGRSLYLAAGASGVNIPDMMTFRGTPAAAAEFLEGDDFRNTLPRFDFAVASSLDEIDAVIRPNKAGENSLVRPRGTIFFRGDPGGNPLLEFIHGGGTLRSSRCGDFKIALRYLSENRDIAANLAHYLVSHAFPVEEIGEAFLKARGSSSLKVIVKHL